MRGPNISSPKILIKISLQTKKGAASDAVTYLETIFKAQSLDILLKRSKLANQIIVQAVLKVESTVWNDAASELYQTIHNLGHDWKKEINSESVL